MNILWIDPWTTTVGFAIISDNSWSPKIENYWIIETIPKDSLQNKLLDIWKDIDELITMYKPEIVSIEKLFFTNNIKTGIDVAHARWVLLHECAKSWAYVLEYTPLEVKSAITGHWQADKKQLQRAIQILFKLDSIPKPDDAADAIWLAYMWYLNRNSTKL
jgi:crossover junction endodeoxyribonuclease RuvC